MNSIIKYLICISCLGIGFFLFNILSVLLPNKPIKQQINKDIEFYKVWGDYNRPIANKQYLSFDYFTDALIMNIAISTNNKKPVYSSLAGCYHDKFDVYDNSRWVYLQHISSSDTYPLESNSIYPRYWHGASFFYRFFFLFMDYASLRLLLHFVTSILLFVFLIRQYNLSNWQTAVSFLLGLLFVNLMFMQYLIQFSSVLIISLSISIAVQSYFKKAKKDIGILFLLSGALTVYFDLLTAPVLSLGFPLLVWLQLYLSKYPANTKKAFLNILLFGTLWAVSYCGIFFFKWILVSIFTDIDIITNVKGAVNLRVGINDNRNRISVLSKNINSINLLFLSISLIMAIVYSSIKLSLDKVKHALLYLLVGLIPMVWMLVVNEHSDSHFWFSYRILAVSIIALFLFIFSFRQYTTSTPKQQVFKS